MRNNRLEEARRNWERNAEDDPLRSILAIPKQEQWDVREFFASGEREIETVFGYLEAHGLAPSAGSALDFGCGVGRLTQALALRFGVVSGTDISERMIELARQYNSHGNRCHYVLNSADLRMFADDHFDFVYSSIVLQHIPTENSLAYLREMIRVLRPGGLLVFQIPVERRVRLVRRVREAMRVRSRLRDVGHRAHLLQFPSVRVEMNTIPSEVLQEVIGESSGRIADTVLTNSTSRDGRDDLSYLTAPPLDGYVSRQYSVLKESAGAR